MKKGAKGISALESVVVTRQHQMCSDHSCCFHQDCHVTDEQKAALKKAARVSGGKDECSSAIERERTRLLDGHRDRHAWRLWVLGPSNGR